MGYLQNYIKKDNEEKVIEKHITDLDVDKIMNFMTNPNWKNGHKVPESPEFFKQIRKIMAHVYGAPNCVSCWERIQDKIDNFKMEN